MRRVNVEVKEGSAKEPWICMCIRVVNYVIKAEERVAGRSSNIPSKECGKQISIGKCSFRVNQSSL